MGMDPFTLATIASAVVGGANFLQGQGAKKDAESAAAAERARLAAEAAKPAVAIADESASNAARRRSIADQMRRRGRQSTILTAPPGAGDTLGT